MKRSDMVDLLAEQFVLRGMCSKEMSRHAGNEVLEQIEKAGMLPPSNPNKYNPVPTVTPMGNHDYSFIREWEEE